ncbi:hypothetical protein MPSI1_002379 [Malassezia psittaci]|uniref:Ysc84 actin-binding domain-containing protein n=1 Tax=Malassezia psittaci TaxID=1821823 RepID=A0AAF0FA69_9BASI|nr:hypothetical protein MPSI1_002379 [Malassezia psittaci]
MASGEQSSWTSWKDKAWASAKKVETKAWNVLEPVGKLSNNLAGRLGMESFWPTTMDKEIEKCARIITTFTRRGAPLGDDNVPHESETNASDKYADRKTQKVAFKIPEKILQDAKGVAIFTVFRTGMAFSGASGSGVVITKDENGEWGGPSGILIHTLGWGFVIGADIYDVVLVLRSDRAVNAFKYPKISVGGELSVAAGPVGNGAMLDSGVEAAPCLSYVKSKGLYFGLQLDGTVILTRGDENSRFYNYPEVPVTSLLDNKLPRHQLPRECMPLWQALCAAEGRPDHLGTDKIIEGPTPGDQEYSEEEMQALQQQASQYDEKTGIQEKPLATGSGQAPLPPPRHPSTLPQSSSELP